MRKQAFTLIEMLVVIAIIALLTSLLVPAVSSALRRAKMATCMSNLRQAGLGLTQYAAENRGRYPVCEFAEFRGGTYGMVGLLEDYLPFSTVKDRNGNQTEWVDPRNSCPLYYSKNRGYGNSMAYGSYAYRHVFQGNTGSSPPTRFPNGNRLAGYAMDDLRGDASAGAWQIFRWTASQYGIVWDMGWTDSTLNTTPHDFDGIPAHAPDFHVLFADGRVAAFPWVHTHGVIPNGQTPNVPPELRSDSYGLR